MLLSVLLPFPPGRGAGAARFVCPGMLTGTPRCPGGLWQGFGVPSTAAPLPEPRVQGLGRAATGRGQSEEESTSGLQIRRRALAGSPAGQSGEAPG